MGLYAHEGWEGRWHRASGRLGGWQDAHGQKQGYAPRRRRLRRYARLYARVSDGRAARGTRGSVPRVRPLSSWTVPQPSAAEGIQGGAKSLQPATHGIRVPAYADAKVPRHVEKTPRHHRGLVPLAQVSAECIGAALPKARAREDAAPDSHR